MEQEEVAEQQAPTQTLLQDLAQAEKRLTTLQQQPNKDKQQIADVRECVRFRRQLVLEQEKTRRARIKASLRAENPKKRRLALSGATEGALSSVLATLEIRTPMITPNLVDVPRAVWHHDDNNQQSCQTNSRLTFHSSFYHFRGAMLNG
eukprot:TRINITY_DN3374_c0_g1_i3.p1 TRINITY_DN3374_c0_g1~~TRINITY_DN3374_c0_g1_i3.p1  ORF type:complete len:149 (-),score=23.47 TRINITY_DN3374_c0_g1_i3:756-1202(-)